VRRGLLAHARVREFDENRSWCDATRKLWYKDTMRRSISTEVLQQIKTAYAAGIGLREIARNMNVPEGTVLARAKRESWTQQIAAAKIADRPELAKQIVKSDAINAITPMQSVAAVMEERGERYRERIAGVSEKVVGHVERLPADEILTRSAQLEKIDTVARRTFGLNDVTPSSGALNLNVLTNHSAIQILPAAASPDE
jgi:hypothetical protein